MKLSQKAKDTLIMIFKDYILTAIIVVLVMLLIFKFVGVRSVVIGSSMNPTLNNNDNLIVEKITYYQREPERFDVIVFKLQDDPTTTKDESKDHYIKRIIGLPGETVQIIDGFVYINGELLSEDVYGAEVIDSGYQAVEPITIGENQYFVLGDNRNHSQDSRFEFPGLIDRSQFLGKAWVRFWPFDEMEVID